MHTLRSDAVHVKRHATVSTGSVTQSWLVYFVLLLKSQSKAINHTQNAENYYITEKGIKSYLTIYKIQVNFVQSASNV